MRNLRVNKGKSRIVKNSTGEFYCYAVKTKVVTIEDTIYNVIDEYVAQGTQPGDIVFISEKMLACTQGRAIRIDEIKPSFLAGLLSKYVTKTPSGIGLGMPETMQCAIDQAGLIRILVASCAGALGKFFNLSGWFYRVAGKEVSGIDGPCKWTIPPYNEYVVLSPEAPQNIVDSLNERYAGITFLVVDLNDLGGEILASSDDELDKAETLELLKQNPLGQSTEGTPVGILRKVDHSGEENHSARANRSGRENHSTTTACRRTSYSLSNVEPLIQ